MKTRMAITLLLIATIVLGGCDREARMSQQGFRLPDGDPEAGRAAFLYMQCHQCHSKDNCEHGKKYGLAQELEHKLSPARPDVHDR